MKKLLALICAITVCAVIVATIWTFYSNSSVEQTRVEDKALRFIEDVLPFDSAQYNITLQSYGVPKLPDLGSTQPINGEQEILTYTLESKDSTIDVICTIQNNGVSMVNADLVKGTLVNEKTYSNLVDATTGFLQKYQTHSTMDSTKMIDILSNVKSVENTTITSDTLKLTVNHINTTGTVFGDSVSFRWVQTFNGCEYLSLSISFKNGVFSGFIDRRVSYKIGDTDVNISKEQAIKSAMEAIKTYSYNMSDDWVVTGFNVTEEQVVAVLQPQTKESNVLYPAWSVTLPLNGTWPGSVRELLVRIWAGSGEVYSVHHQAYASIDVLPDESSSDSSTTTPYTLENNHTDKLTTEEKTQAFIENVLPVDLTQYNITLDHHSTDNGPPILGTTRNPINRTQENLRYILDSEKSSLRITFLIENNTVFSCGIYEHEGQVIKDRIYNSINDETKTFLEKYQSYTKEDLSDLINLIDDLDVTKNFTATIGNHKLVISNRYIYGIELTNFDWSYTENGAEYTSLKFSFENGNLHSILDNRKVFTIGDTSINISSEQAIKIALDHLPSYSYEMPDHTWITNFNVTEDKITTAIETAFVNYPEMRPYWHVALPLNQTYPGSVQGIAVFIWANSGEIISCSNIAYGGIQYPEDD